MIRKILVPVRGDGKGNNVLAHFAAALARAFNAHIVVTSCCLDNGPDQIGEEGHEFDSRGQRRPARVRRTQALGPDRLGLEVSPAAVQEYLARHGVAADIEPVKKSNSVAKALLDTSGRHSAETPRTFDVLGGLQ